MRFFSLSISVIINRLSTDAPNVVEIRKDESLFGLEATCDDILGVVPGVLSCHLQRDILPHELLVV